MPKKYWVSIVNASKQKFERFWISHISTTIGHKGGKLKPENETVKCCLYTPPKKWTLYDNEDNISNCPPPTINISSNECAKERHRIPDGGARFGKFNITQ
jgi:hypothetical protein